MLGAIGATWSKPEHPGGPEPVEAVRLLESGQVGGVLALGSEALITLGHQGSRLEDLRGRVLPLLNGEHQVPVIVSFALQHLLREPMDKAGAWRDLQLARSLQAQGACFPISETESNLA
jgi:DNA polymerase